MTGGYTAIVIEAPNDDGQTRVYKATCPPGDEASLGFLQGLVGGYVEHLCMPDGKLDFWFNEESGPQLQDLPVNHVGTDQLWIRWPEFTGWDALHGVVVLTGNRHSSAADVPDDVWGQLTSRYRAVESITFEDGA